YFMKSQCLFLVIIIFLGFGCPMEKEPAKTWEVYTSDLKSSSYSALTQINKNNVAQLQRSCTFLPNYAVAGGRPTKSEANPIIVDSVMYISSARTRIYAINATTGKKIWSFDPFNEGRGGSTNRGVTYWEN